MTAHSRPCNSSPTTRFPSEPPLPASSLCDTPQQSSWRSSVTISNPCSPCLPYDISFSCLPNSLTDTRRFPQGNTSRSENYDTGVPPGLPASADLACVQLPHRLPASPASTEENRRKAAQQKEGPHLGHRISRATCGTLQPLRPACLLPF